MAFFVACGVTAVAAQTRTIRIVTYNIEADTGGFTTPRPGVITPSIGGTVTNGGVLEGIGEEILGSDPAQPIDIVALEETTSNPTTVTPIVNGLNAFYSSRNISAGYAMSTNQATQNGSNTGGNGPNALVYNTNTLHLVASEGIGTPHGSSNGEYRQVERCTFVPVGVPLTSANLYFYIYVSHYKASTGTANEAARAKEAGIIRTNSASLPSDARVIYVGDFNASSSSEPMYQTLVGPGLGIRGIDPLNPSGVSGLDWGTFTSDASVLAMLTESSTNLRYRDDYHLMSSNVYFGVSGGLAYVSGTLHTFGNDGSTPYNGTVNSGSNTSLNSNLTTNGTGISAADLYQDLTFGADHLPVVADYTIPVPDSSPVASFTASPTNGVNPLTVTFTDTSSGSVTNSSWSFGDGGTTNVATSSVVYTYAAAGTYVVTETVSGSGGSGTNTQVNLITVLDPFTAWQLQYFNCTNCLQAQGDADPLGKGMSNTNQFLAGLNPTNPASVFRITSVVTDSSNNVLITWSTAGVRTNAVQATVGDGSGGYSNNFQDISGATAEINISGDTTANYTDVGGATNTPTRFYRIRLVP